MSTRRFKWSARRHSPDDPPPVFEMIATHARALCRAAHVSVVEFDGALPHNRAISGFTPAGVEHRLRAWPRAPGAGNLHDRVVQEGHAIRSPSDPTTRISPSSKPSLNTRLSPLKAPDRSGKSARRRSGRPLLRRCCRSSTPTPAIWHRCLKRCLKGRCAFAERLRASAKLRWPACSDDRDAGFS